MTDASPWELDCVREEIAKEGVRVEWIGRDAQGLVWAVVYSPETGRRYKWPGMFAWRNPLPGEVAPPRKPAGKREQQKLLF